MTFRRSSDGTLTPENIAFSGGRIVAVTGSGGAVSFVANHHVTDHLGSVRAVVDGSTGQVVETNDYYAFGGRCDRSGSLVDQSNRFRYNDKEEQATFGTSYSDYGARLYSSASGQWLAVDPLAEKYYSYSPYAFCNNNPVNFVDPDGRLPDVLWDIASIGMGVRSFVQNIKSGNVSGAVGDAVGIAIDAVAAAKASNKKSKLQKTAEIGQEAHRQIEKELKISVPETETEVRMKVGNQNIRKDAVMPDGTVVIIKPDTPSGHKAAARRDKMMKNNGYKT